MLYFTAVFDASSIHWYKCTDAELETAYEQATKTGLIQNILLGIDNEKFIMISFWRN